MAEIIESENIDDIENILRNFECDKSISLKMINCLPGSRQGDNYMSVVKRVIADGTHKDEELAYHKSLIVKRQIASMSRRQLFRADQAFNNEIIAYSQIVPKIHNFSILNNFPSVNCLYAGVDSNGEIIVLEDLQESGYKMANRLKGLDYNHCKVAMQALAILHGTSLAMKQLQSNEFESLVAHLNESIYCDDGREFYGHCVESSLKEALFSLRNSNQDCNLDVPIEKIEKLTGRLYDIMFDTIHGNDPKWTVVAHGDLWVNNLMFKYNSSAEVDDVKFIDLQTLRYTSPAIDILHFLYSSTEYSTRVEYMEQLLDDYVSSLIDTMKQYGIENDEFQCSQFVGKVIRSEIQRNILYGLGICMWLMPAVTFHPEKIPDLDSVTLNDFTSSNQEKNMTQLQTPEYHVRIKETVLEFFEKGHLNDVT